MIIKTVRFRRKHTSLWEVGIMIETEDRTSFVSKSGAIVKGINDYVPLQNIYLDLTTVLLTLQLQTNKNINNK